MNDFTVQMNAHLSNNVTSLPAEERLVERLELEPQFAHVVRNAKTVGERCQPINDVFICVRDESLAERILSIEHKVCDALDAVLGENRFFIKMNNPVVGIENVHAVLQAVLKRSRLEHRARLRLVIFRNDDLAYPPVLWDIYGFISNHLDQKVLQTGF